jgi:hypothetical protein
MSRHHNTKHPLRGVSHYPSRLKRRGFSKSPELESSETLRKRQEKRVAETCTLGDNHEHRVNAVNDDGELICNGRPWWTGSAEELTDTEAA